MKLYIIFPQYTGKSSTVTIFNMDWEQKELKASAYPGVEPTWTEQGSPGLVNVRLSPDMEVMLMLHSALGINWECHQTCQLWLYFRM